MSTQHLIDAKRREIDSFRRKDSDLIGKITSLNKQQLREMESFINRQEQDKRKFQEDQERDRNNFKSKQESELNRLQDQLQKIRDALAHHEAEIDRLEKNLAREEAEKKF